MLSITDPAILFPGISLLFLAYTNRYLALASIIRELNKVIDEHYDNNREQQINNLLVRVKLIRHMQLFGILAFICCIISMSALLLGQQSLGQFSFGASMVCTLLSLCIALAEVAKSGDGLRLEIERTHNKKNSNNSD